MTPLYVELNRWLAVPFVWGECDCMLACCDWVEKATGRDPGAGLRFAYHDRSSCQRLTRYLTDPLGVTSRCMASVGLPVTETPVEGDVAVVQVMLEGRIEVAGAVCLGDHGWAMKAPHGATTVKSVVAVLRAWSVGYAA